MMRIKLTFSEIVTLVRSVTCFQTYLVIIKCSIIKSYSSGYCSVHDILVLVGCLKKCHYEMNTVDYLLQNSFSSHSEEMKLEIKHFERHIPENFEINQRKKNLKTETSKKHGVLNFCTKL